MPPDRISHECGHGSKADKCYPGKKPGHGIRSLRIDNTHIRLKEYRAYLQQEERQIVHMIQPLAMSVLQRQWTPSAAKHLTSYYGGRILTLLVIRSEIQKAGGVPKGYRHTPKQNRKHTESETGKDIPHYPHSTGYEGSFLPVKNILSPSPFSCSPAGQTGMTVFPNRCGPT